jgi:hypothetical protein
MFTNPTPLHLLEFSSCSTFTLIIDPCGANLQFREHVTHLLCQEHLWLAAVSTLHPSQSARLLMLLLLLFPPSRLLATRMN